MQLSFDEAPPRQKSDLVSRFFHIFGPNQKGKENRPTRYPSPIHRIPSKRTFNTTDFMCRHYMCHGYGGKNSTASSLESPFKVKRDYVLTKQYFSCGKSLFFTWSVFRNLAKGQRSAEKIPDMFILASYFCWLSFLLCWWPRNLRKRKARKWFTRFLRGSNINVAFKALATLNAAWTSEFWRKPELRSIVLYLFSTLFIYF